MNYTVLIIDDEENLCWLLRETFLAKGYNADFRHTLKDGFEYIQKEHPDIVILDVNLPDGNGTTLLKTLNKEMPETIVIMLTAQNSVKLAVDCLKAGASHFLTKPFVNKELLIRVEQAIEERLREDQLEALHSQILRDGSLGEIIGTSEPMKNLFALIKQVSSIDSTTTVLITGETGTGKETVAKAVHSQSKRKDCPFMAINCTALPDSLLESELFGHEKGSFTGADKQRRGFFELAKGGSLFLDEIGELSPGAQAKLLRVLQEKKIMRVGGTKDIAVDVRVIAATNRNLQSMIKTGEFRDDLYFRLNVFPIHVPPLRDRGDDILLLANHFLKRIGNKLKLKGRTFSKEAFEAMGRNMWPGNVRQLQNLIERALLTSTNEEMNSINLSLNSQSTETKKNLSNACSNSNQSIDTNNSMSKLEKTVYELVISEKPSIAELEQVYIESLMKEYGNRRTVSDILGIDTKTLYRKLKKYERE